MFSNKSNNNLAYLNIKILMKMNIQIQILITTIIICNITKPNKL